MAQATSPFTVFTVDILQIENLSATWYPIAEKRMQSLEEKTDTYARAAMSSQILLQCQSIEKRPSYALLCLKGKHPLAFTTLTEGSEYGVKTLNIDFLCAHPSKNGQGGGSELINNIEALAHSLGIKTLKAEVAKSARGFYEKHHFGGSHDTLYKRVTEAPALSIPPMPKTKAQPGPVFVPSYMFNAQIIRELIACDKSRHAKWTLPLSFQRATSQRSYIANPTRFIVDRNADGRCSALCVINLLDSKTIEVRQMVDFSQGSTSIPKMIAMVKALGAITNRNCVIDGEPL